MISLAINIKDEIGFHARTASLFAKKASKFESEIFIEFKGKKVNAKSTLSIMTLGVKSNDEIVLRGNDAPSIGGYGLFSKKNVEVAVDEINNKTFIFFSPDGVSESNYIQLNGILDRDLSEIIISTKEGVRNSGEGTSNTTSGIVSYSSGSDNFDAAAFSSSVISTPSAAGAARRALYGARLRQGRQQHGGPRPLTRCIFPHGMRGAECDHLMSHRHQVIVDAVLGVFVSSRTPPLRLTGCPRGRCGRLHGRTGLWGPRLRTLAPSTRAHAVQQPAPFYRSCRVFPAGR